MNLSMIFVVISMISLIVGFEASAEEKLLEPSFGLTWEFSEEQFAEAFDVSERKVEGDLVIVATSAVSEKLPSNTDTLFALFWNDKLVKFEWTSSTFNGDVFGNQGKEVYAALSEELTSKFGKGTSYHFSGLEIYKDQDEFYECLSYTGCGTWLTIWASESNENNLAALQLKGLSRGVGFVSYGVEHPDWHIYNQQKSGGDVTKF